MREPEPPTGQESPHRNPRHDNRITVDPRALDAILISLSSVARFIDRHDSMKLGPIVRDITKIGQAVREIRTGGTVPDKAEPFEVGLAMNRLNQLVARADALSRAAGRLVADAAEAASDAAEMSRWILVQLGEA